MKTFNLGIGVVLALLFIVQTPIPAQQANTCDVVPEGLLLTPRSEYQGLYINKEYHYSVRIPNNLVGYDQPNPPHHGFGIIIGDKPQSYIEVNGEANSLEYETPREAALRLVEYLRHDGKAVQAQAVRQVRLGGLDAAFLQVTYRCPGSSVLYKQGSAVALSPDRSALYEISLYAPADRYESDRAVLNGILTSWKYVGQ